MTRILVLATTGLLVSCAGGSGSRSELLSDWRPPGGQSCSVPAAPARLPPASDLVDPARLQESVVRAVDRRSGYALFSLVQDTTGAWQRVAVIESDLPEAEQERLTEVLRPQLRESPHRLLRLRLDLGDPVRMAVGRQEHCAPALRNADEINRRLVDIGTHYPRQATVVVRVRVHTDGTPGDFEMVRGSGDARINEDVLSVVRHMRFHPALHDRIPVEVGAEFPLRINVERPG